MDENIIETFDLSKIYHLKGHDKKIVALKDINIKVKKGEIYGLLGPNGAGKTTIIQILTTLMHPTSGYAILNGFNILKDPLAIKRRIGLMLGAELIYNRLKGYDNLKFFCKIYNIPNYNERIKSISKEFDLYDWLDQYVEKYSTGMKAKLALCRALLIDPPILFLDEPTIGLDVNTTNYFIEKIKNLNKTIFLTTHNMGVAEKLCQYIAFINRGKIVKTGTQQELKDWMQLDINIEIQINKNKDPLKKELLKHNFIKNVSVNDDILIINLKNKRYYKDLFSILSNFSDIKKIQEKEITLETLFTMLK